MYPHPAILTDDTADLLTAYVRQGGTVVFGCRTGYKDTTRQCYMRLMPGPVADLCGVTVDDFTRIEPNEPGTTLRWRDSDDATLATGAFNDILQVEAPGAEVLAEYVGGYYAGALTLVWNSVGDGSAYY